LLRVKPQIVSPAAVATTSAEAAITNGLKNFLWVIGVAPLLAQRFATT
jgi:hypothetical protein